MAPDNETQTYLLSPTALADVDGYLANWLPSDTDTPQERRLRESGLLAGAMNWLQGGAVCYWRIQREGAWFSMTPGHVRTGALLPWRVYFRLEGDRYLVTDLGTASRAVRLKTGCSASEASEALVRVLDVEENLHEHWRRQSPAWRQGSFLLSNAEGAIEAAEALRSGVSAAVLPAAIVQVACAMQSVATASPEAVAPAAASAP